MIPLLLCAPHIAKPLFILTEERAEGSRFCLGGGADAASTGKKPFRRTNFNNTKEAGRPSGPLALVEATALAEVVDNST